MNGRILNWGMVLSLAANVLALRAGGQAHAVAGAVFVALASCHVWKHKAFFIPRPKGGDRRTMVTPALWSEVLGPKLQAHSVMRHVSVLHYIPGRIRLFSPLLRGNASLAADLANRFQAVPEVLEHQINTVTGSVLIRYNPDAVRQNPLLAEIERLARKQTKGATS